MVLLGRQTENLGIGAAGSACHWKLGDGDETEAWPNPFCLQGLRLLRNSES